jgi:8-oxo-dGTP diphosphatase
MPHIHELIDFTVGFYIVHGNRVLLVNHPRYQKWICPGGHIELDEDPEQALYREIAEETGLEVEILSTKPDIEVPGTKFLLTPNHLDIHEANSPHKHVALVYFARSKSGEAVLSDEHEEIRWFTDVELDDVSNRIPPEVRFYAHEALKAAKA